MSVGPQIFQVNCAGGLNLTSTTAELFQNPGYATKLINFESSHKGGYRRINGYSIGGTDTQPAGAANAVLGVFPYADGTVAVQYDGTNYAVYFSTDHVTWLKVSKSMTYATGLDSTALAAAAEVSRTGSGRVIWALFEGGTDYGEVAIADGANNLAIFKVEGTGAGRTYHFDVVSAVGNVQWAEIYKDRLVVGGNTTSPNTVYWSHTNAPNDYTSANAGSLDMPSKVRGIKEWRDRLFIFGEKSIDEISGIISNAVGSAAVENVTRNVGCISGFSIQEVGGDVIFLSVDGFRTLAGTDRIDDIELGSISRAIDPLVQDIVSVISTYDVSSMVIRDKNQYRFFYCKSAFAANNQKGLIATIKAGPEGLRWEWAEIQGIPVSSCYSGVVNGNEIHYHGGYDGYIYTHDDGDSFDGGDISAYYESPEIDYGNLARRDTLHWMKLSAKVEGAVNNLKLRTTFNFSDSDMTHNPNDIVIVSIDGLSVYGTAIYGTSTYSGPTDIEERINLVGAGFSNKFMFYTVGTQAPYSIQSYLIKYHEGAVQ